ncbi:helix-turn-helix domain-containing protein [Nocardia sp. NPDC056000]|uniref:helix-turn-helix domain-containing protein n=1 Tax=Nocardia sp. NPDC056000 TaxID=3345674 RepID=UPI0035D79405
MQAAPIASVVWLWAAPEAATAIATRDLPTILRAYRRVNGLNQIQLGELLGYDSSYISMIETGRRPITDVTARRHIAGRLGIPAHVLGITGTDDAEFRAMLQFGDSTVRLAEIARQSGHAAEAVNELWPLVARLEARAAEGHLERDSLVLLAQARVGLGVSLGAVLPEERLSSAARWTGQAVTIAARLDDPMFRAYTLRMHGNELRKAGHPAAAVARLKESKELSRDPAALGGTLAFMCRAFGVLGDAERFDTALHEYRTLLEGNTGSGLLFQPFTLREIELRGLLCTGRAAEAGRLVHVQAGRPAAPQWRIIERVTTGEVLAAVNELDSAAVFFEDAIEDAEHRRLPHQIQRAIRATAQAGLDELATEARAALARIRSLLGSGRSE